MKRRSCWRFLGFRLVFVVGNPSRQLGIDHSYPRHWSILQQLASLGVDFCGENMENAMGAWSCSVKTTRVP